mgnify:CR=1 FL=1
MAVQTEQVPHHIVIIGGGAGDDVSLYIRPESNSSGKRIFDSGRAGKSFG